MPFANKILPRNSRIITGTTCPDVARKIAKNLHTKLVPINLTRFPVSEKLPQITETLRGKKVFLIATANTGSIDEDLVETSRILHTLSLQSIENIHLIMLGMPYLRQDKKFEPGQDISADWAIRLLFSEARGKLHSFITFDAHTDSTELAMTAMGIPYPASLTFKSAQTNYIRKNFDLNNAMLMAPDMGRYKVVSRLAKELFGLNEFENRLIPANKTKKNGKTHVTLYQPIDLLGTGTGWMDPKGRDVILFDDMTDKGGTMLAGTDALYKWKGHEPRSVTCMSVFGYLSDETIKNETIKKFDEHPHIDKVVITNAVDPKLGDYSSPKLTTLDISHLVSEIIWRMAANKSLKDYHLVFN